MLYLRPEILKYRDLLYKSEDSSLTPEQKTELKQIFNNDKLSELEKVQITLKILSMKPRKSMGQNYICDDKSAEIIAHRLNISFADYIEYRYVDDKRTKPHEYINFICPYDITNILETGPGLGSLTKFLFSLSLPLTLIEKDKVSCDVLSLLLENNNFELCNMDVLDFPLLNYLEENSIEYGLGLLNYSNLPYSISTDYLEMFCVHAPLACHTLLLQKEVVDKLVAEPYSSNYVPLSVLTDLFFYKKVSYMLGPWQFFPKPNVESVLIMMTPRDHDTFIKLASHKIEAKFDLHLSCGFDHKKGPISFCEIFYCFLKLCFSNRRKTLRNVIRNNFKDFEALFTGCGESIRTIATIITVINDSDLPQENERLIWNYLNDWPDDITDQEHFLNNDKIKMLYSRVSLKFNYYLSRRAETFSTVDFLTLFISLSIMDYRDIEVDLEDEAKSKDKLQDNNSDEDSDEVLDFNDLALYKEYLGF